MCDVWDHRPAQARSRTSWIIRWFLGQFFTKGGHADLILRVFRVPVCRTKTQIWRRVLEREAIERRHLEEGALLDRRRRDLESAIDPTVPKTMQGPDSTCTTSATGTSMTTQSVIKCCSKLAQRTGKYEDEPGLTHAIMKPWSNKNCTLASKLRITCKSHKPAGDVSFRNVHASVGYKLAGVAQLFLKKVRSRIRGCNHLLINSKNVESLKRSRVRDTNYWIKFDIQDCYMKDDLIADAFETFRR